MSEFDFEDQRQALAVMDSRGYQNGWQQPTPKSKPKHVFFNKDKDESFTKKKEWKDMSFDELITAYDFEKFKLSDLYEQYKLVPIDEIKKNLSQVSYRMSLIMSNIKTINPEYKQETSENNSDLKREISELKRKNKQLNDVNYSLINSHDVVSLKEDIKARGVQIEALKAKLSEQNKTLKDLRMNVGALDSRANQFEKFKVVVRHEFGTDKYLELLSKVDEE